jgi:hypothetical protein
MAVPEMIGGPGSAILYSGSQTVFDAHRALLDLWGESTYFGSDAGVASLQSLEFSDLSHLIAASTEQGVSAEVLLPVHQMIRRQIAAGHGKEGFARIFEEIRRTR